MEYQYTIHHKLLEFFTKTYSPNIKLNHEEFSKEIAQTYHDFIEECGNNVDFENDPRNNMFFTNIRYKYIEIKEQYFQIKNSNSFVYLPTEEELSNKSDNNYAKILSTLLSFLNRVIRYLDSMVKRYPKKLSNSNSKNKPEYPNFLAKIDYEYLEDAYGQLIKFGFISEKTSLDSFKSVFQRKLPSEKIRWKKGPGFLQYFINSINGKGIYEITSKWKTTLNCFMNDKTDSDFTIAQLQYGHDPKNTKDIDLVIQTFNENINE